MIWDLQVLSASRESEPKSACHKGELGHVYLGERGIAEMGNVKE